MNDKNLSPLEKAGFDEFLNRSSEEPSLFTRSTANYSDQVLGYQPEILDDESSMFIRQLSGSSIAGGITKSQDGKLQVDWAKGSFIANDGSRNRVEIGRLPGSQLFGIRIYDASGDEIFSAAGELQSSGIADGAVITTKIANLAVTNAKIGALSASKIVTGTLIAKDGDDAAKIVVRDSEDNDIVTLDTSGITINTGKMTIKDADETTIIDATGLVSEANFDFDAYSASATFNTNSTTPVIVTGSNLSIVLTRSARVLLLMSGRVFTASSGGAEAYINVEGTNYNPGVYVATGGAGAGTHAILNLAEGTHTAAIYLVTADPAKTASITARRLSYLVLGK